MKKQSTITIITAIGVSAIVFCLGFLFSQNSNTSIQKNDVVASLACERSNALDGFDYFSKPINKSIFEMRTVGWSEFSSPTDNLTFKYPKNLSVNKENVGDGGVGVYYITLPTTAEFVPLLKIEVDGELPTSEGWSSEELFNNQNDINKQLSRFAASSTIFDYEPCVVEPQHLTSRVLVRTDDGLHLLLKNSIPYYVHASLMISPDASNWDKEWEEELVLVLNSIHFKSTY